jgi:phosphoglucosamine mutase
MRLFGTDGVRGRVGEEPMTPECVLRLAQAAGLVLSRETKPMVLIGKDTRVSGYLFESALEAGLLAAGVNVRLIGPLPTPGVAYLTKTFRASCGLVISASHNPYMDNGIKFLNREGGKMDRTFQLAVEDVLARPFRMADSRAIGKASRLRDAQGRYVEYCKATLAAGMSLDGLVLALDCAHGAAYRVAPDVFEELGARVVSMGVAPDGYNINEHCGSTDPAALCDLVRSSGAHGGIALDGDGDRVILGDEYGAVVDAAPELFILAMAWARHGRLRGPVVTTTMSNLALEQALARAGIPLVRVEVGDHHVAEAMRRSGANLGGEPSGHILCLDRSTTGDGIVAALQVLEVMVATGQSLHQLVQGYQPLPQVLVNVPVSACGLALEEPRIQRAMALAAQALASRGRVVVRPSGTEAVIRVMVEGVDQQEAEEVATSLAALLTG